MQQNYRLTRPLGDGCGELEIDIFAAPSREAAVVAAITKCMSYIMHDDRVGFIASLQSHCTLISLRGWRYVLTPVV